MPYVLAWCILYSADWPSRLLEKHSCQFFWKLSTLKMRGENLQRWGWIARKVEPIPWYCKGELRSRMSTLGFWWSTLHCPQKSVFSRYSWSLPFNCIHHCCCARTAGHSMTECLSSLSVKSPSDARQTPQTRCTWKHSNFIVPVMKKITQEW